MLKTEGLMWDIRLPPWCKYNLHASEMLHSVDWWLMKFWVWWLTTNLCCLTSKKCEDLKMNSVENEWKRVTEGRHTSDMLTSYGVDWHTVLISYQGNQAFNILLRKSIKCYQVHSQCFLKVAVVGEADSEAIYLCLILKMMLHKSCYINNCNITWFATAFIYI